MKRILAHLNGSDGPIWLLVLVVCVVFWVIVVKLFWR